jgi:hypothetical protein
MKNNIILYFLIYIFQVSMCLAQSSSINTSKSASDIQFSNKGIETEIVYIQTSKGVYETGEDVWFKAYILDAQYLVPSGLSQTLYLELINEETRNVYWQEKYEIKNRFADGHVYLHDTLPEGNYLLAAFTPYSFFNDSSEFKSFRRIVVKKDMKPRVLLIADFTKTSFTSADSIGLQIEVLSEKSEPLYAEIIVELKKEGEILQTIKTVTKKEEKAMLYFDPGFTESGLEITIRAKHPNATEKIKKPVPFHKGNPILFDLFPEGGYLVSGLKNKVAFKTEDTSGKPVDIRGTLFENGDTLLHFEPIHVGMGSFDFIPDKNNKYYIRLEQPYSDIDWHLPEIIENGILFRLEKRDTNFLVFKVRQTPGANDRVVCLKGQLRGNVYCFQSGVLAGELEIIVPMRDFPGQGIAEFTLLDENMLPIAERLVYVNPDYKLYIGAELSKEKYSTRDKVTLTLKVTDKYGQPVVAHLGVSIFDNIYHDNKDPINIFTNYYLSSQLKGMIYNPAYYFDEQNKDRLEALDMLLLTQGWRRYIWHETNELPQKQPVVFNGIKGTINATKKSRTASEGNQVITIYNPAVNEHKYMLLADSTGSFEISPSYLKLGQGGHVYLKPLGAEEYGYEIKPGSPFDSIKKVLNQKTIVSATEDKILSGETKTRPFLPGPNVIEIDEVIIKGEQKYQFREKYMGYLDSLAKVHFDPGDYVCISGHLNCPVHEGHPGNTKPVEGKTYAQYVGFEWDGPQKQFYTIKGYVYIKYQHPKFTEDFLLKRFNLVRVKGYYIEREFYQPQYSSDSMVMIPDYRNTLLWAPNVLTDRNGNATLEFFCSDIYTDFVGTIEGVSGDGRMGHDKIEFKVLKTELFKWEK